MGNQESASDGFHDGEELAQPLGTRDLPAQGHHRSTSSKDRGTTDTAGRSNGRYPQKDYEDDVSAAAKANAAGVVNLRNAHYEEAVKQFKIALEYEPGSVQILNNIGLAYAKLKNFDAAHEWYKKAYEQDTSDIETVFSLAWVERKRQHYREARELFVKVLQVQPDHVKALYLLGDILKSAQDYEGAIPYFKQLVKLDSKNVDGQVCLAQCYQQAKQLSLAAEAYSNALNQVRPTNLDSRGVLEALEGAAYCHRKLNNLDTAVQLYEQAHQVSPNAETPMYYLGDILYRQHRHAECQHYLAKLVACSTSMDYKTGALYLLAKSHVSVEEYGPAEKYATTGLGLKRQHPHFLFILALVKNRTADYDASITLLLQALEHCEAPEDSRAEGSEQLKHEIRDWLAQAYERKQDYKAAMQQVDLALQGDPSHVSALITKGQVHLQLRQVDQAETAFRRALAVERNHALALLRLGYCKLLASAHQEATQHFQRALQQRCGTVALPMSVKGAARVYLALTLMSQQDIDGSLQQLLEARQGHKNFKEVCSTAKETIVKGDCEGLVGRLRKIPDLDINTAQAWQLVHLMAKELELELQNKVKPEGDKGSLASNGTQVKAVSSTSRQDGPRQMPLTALHALSLQAPPSAVGVAVPLKDPVVGRPSPALNGISDYQARARQAWTTPAEAENRHAWNAAPPEENRRKWNLPAESENKRQWSTGAEAEKKRSWVTPAPKEQAAPAAPRLSMNQGEKLQQPLKLESHELIDVSEIKQGECLGTGGFGAVYKGTFRGKEVALKKLFCEDGGNISPLQLEELEKEVAALKALRHPRLVAFIGASLSPPNLCIVTEFMAGGSLHHLLHKSKTPLTIEQQAKMALQVAEGVAFLHSLTPPVVHRDLKSLNIVLDLDYNAKICDFGLTQSMEKTHISLKDGGNGGSPRYMAPECYDTKGKITEKVDVWAEGCILIEIFGGPLPYDDCQNIHQIVAKVLIDKELPYIPLSLVEGVRPIVEDCFHFDIEKRTTAQDVFTRLKALKFK